MLHNKSSRSGSSFVVADCAALPGELVESLLFGSEKGGLTHGCVSRHGHGAPGCVRGWLRPSRALFKGPVMILLHVDAVMGEWR
ncbi:MAG: sigma 54-interacting transcriptional regulator [Pseudomonadota bacterium]